MAGNRVRHKPIYCLQWCTNSSQPDIALLIKIAKLLDVELDELLNKEFVESI